MKILLGLFLSSILIATMSCNQKETPQQEQASTEKADTIMVIEESVNSEWNEADNVDSPAFWQGDGNYWIIATMKESDGLIIYDARTAEIIKKVGKSGSNELEFKRPNGIWVIDNMVFVVERDNHRIQVLSLPDFKFMGFIAADKLIKPYGMYIYNENESYNLFVTDNYEFEEDVIPADSLLGKRVLNYKVTVKNGKISSEFIRFIGETSGDGVIKVVESIFADENNNRLLIAEELEEDTHIKVYDLSTGKYAGITIGKGLFKYQAEGIALIKCDGNKGFWICTDQNTGDNTFHIFDRISFEHITSFKSKTTQNTDGVWLTQESFPGFETGAFIPVNNDGGIGIFNLGELMEQIGINCEK